MRTTLDIDEDILNAAKALARQQSKSAGQVVTQLLRDALTGQAIRLGKNEAASVAGFRPFGSGGNIVTNDHVNALREQEGV